MKSKTPIPKPLRLIRPLTDGERQMARSVFGDSLALDDIRLTTAWWVLKGYAVSPNGWVYFHKDDFCEDFSDKTLHLRAWLIHELVHIWQIQQGIKVVRKAIFNRKYRYVFKEGKPFLAYGIEQQAKMVEDFYIQRELGKDCTAWRECVPFL
ncbi:type IV secretion protein Rhs [Moraxella bovis]|uniref:Type IV secretion protein Rhs n=1 Tax=Moraxella bovis TaxID=476 RepID=A0AAQ2Q207_MORBO|nr:type IV secretion protein Rhs [Moraxella bovis]UYZ76155.1 type IV secretion protein Rhs [Moraxella bovis]UYZ77891.1 type IV secretion protein Rhs [Moraxella bovis]UYZ86377.1 type IV secretion protein Rhs [Moraxella bovis]UYZ91810.1 type IV secretion protein Rhs [Moraxella bovis]UYZ98279.1 type IV secretion protein Rhs [Moraxella bovis]